MKQVDFGYVTTDGSMGRISIYRMCFQKFHTARHTLKLPDEELLKIVPKVEAVFDFLLEQGNKNGYNVDSILEIPDSGGQTCFLCASECSFKIATDLMKRGIKLNSITISMLVPDFKFPDLASSMMKKGINPNVICYDGRDRIYMNQFVFEDEKLKKQAETFPTSVHYSIDDIHCEESCPSDCSSRFERFYYKNGPLVEMTDENRIGSGGFGMVFRQKFHGKPMAMKCIFFEQSFSPNIQGQMNIVEENISELRIQSASAGSGVIVPVAFVRQQDREQDENGNWIADNYNIYIYPLYDCNLYELHEKHFNQFTEQILNDILNQCLTRIGSNGSRFHPRNSGR